MRLASAFCLISALTLPLIAQKPVLVPDGQQRDHALPPRHSIHTNKFGPMDVFEGIQLDVIVSPNGVVESAHATRGQSPYFAKAERMEMDRRFKPFHPGRRRTCSSIDSRLCQLSSSGKMAFRSYFISGN